MYLDIVKDYYKMAGMVPATHSFRRLLALEISRVKYARKDLGRQASYHYARFHGGDPSRCADGCTMGTPW